MLEQGLGIQCLGLFFIVDVSFLYAQAQSDVQLIVLFLSSFWWEYSLLSFIARSTLRECPWNSRHTLILESNLLPPLAASPSTSPSFLHLQIPRWSNSRFFLHGSLRLQRMNRLLPDPLHPLLG
jgi:hypothetical protein